jgi:predicted Zn-dependent protease with MMP-like domain
MMSQRWRLSRSEFDLVVEEAIGEIPDEFRSLLENVAVIVEEEPSDHDFPEDFDMDDELLGIYRGNPLTERSYDMIAPLPDHVVIFRQPIIRCCVSRDEAIDEIRDTLVHELGHYFGLEDDEMPY